MRILHVISSLEIGGAQRLLSDLLPLLAKNNEVHLLVNENVDNDFTKRIENGGVKVFSMGLPNLFSFKNLINLIKAIKDYDIVHVHLFPSLYWAAFASLFVNVKMVYTEHSTSNKRRERWYLRPIEKFVYSRYSHIISISEQTQEALKSWLNVNHNDRSFTVVHNGVNLQEFNFAMKSPLYPHTLIMVSRFVESKDQNTVIRALSILPNDVHAIFVGDGAHLDECKLEASRLGVALRSHFVGAQSDVVSWLRKADIGVQSSNWEGFGLTVVEMMAAGLPVIASDVSGLKEIIGGAGVLFPKGDYKKLAEIIMFIINNEKFRLKLEGASIIRANYYNIMKTVDGYLKIYKSLA